MAQCSNPDSSSYIMGSNRMIQNQMLLSSDIETIFRRLDDIETEHQTMIKNQEYIIKTLNQVVKTLAEKKTHVKKPPAQRPQNAKSRKSSSSDVSKLLHLPQALQKNISKFTENIVFNPTNIPDELIESECLSEDECSVIASKSNLKDQIRMLIRKIKTRGPQKIEKFLEIIGKEHPDIKQEVNKSLENIISESTNKPVCVICVMRSIVDLKDVGDDLWKAEIISDDIYEDIVECENTHSSRPILWDNIINSINNYKQPDKALEILVSALESKYQHIVEYLRETPERPSLNCSCCRRRRVRSRPGCSEFGSQTDLSTTSEVPKTVLPKTIYMSGEHHSDDRHSITSSQDLLSSSFRGVSYEALDRYDSIGSGSDISRVFSPRLEIQNSTVSSTTSDVVNNNTVDRSRHSSGKFIPQDISQSGVNVDELNRSLPFISEPQNYVTSESKGGDEQRPELKHSISMHSTVTMVANRSTASGEVTQSTSSTDENQNQQSSQSTDGVFSPDVNIPNILANLQHEKSNTVNKETTKESKDEEPLYVRQKAYRRRRHKSSNDTGEEEDQIENQASSYLDRARQRRYQRKRFTRQKSLPYGDITLITTPRPQSDQAAANIGTRPQESRKSKQSMKRELRRQRSQGKINTNMDSESFELYDVEDKGLKKPFNPLWGKDFLQPKLSPKWDHNQAKRYWQMSQLYASSEKVENVKSDTDLRTEELSDTMAYSDFTI